MFLMRKGEVVGRNCDVSAQVLPEVGGLYHIEVNIPVRSFTSGDPNRDKEVEKLLRGADRPEITFRSTARSADKWRELFARKDFPIEGQLFIGTKSFPVALQAHYEEVPEGGALVMGSAKLRFQDLDLRPPAVAAGVLVKAKSEFEVLFQLHSGRILGADSIRLETGKEKR